MKKTVVFGISGITKGLVENIRNNFIKADIDYIFMDKEYRNLDSYEGIPVIDENDLQQLRNQYFIIPTFRHDLRKRWMNIANSLNMEPFNIIHTDTYISKSAKIGKGFFIAQETIIESNVVIGDFFISAYKNRIGHDSIIGDFCHVYVMANIGGFNKIGDNVSICSSSCTKEDVIIGDNAIVGLGAIIFKNVPANATAIGNPAKCIIKP